MRTSWLWENPRSTALSNTRNLGRIRTTADERREIDRRNSGDEFSPWKDAFHVPFPSNPEEYVAPACPKKAAVPAIDPFQTLPVEVSDAIFSLLSVAELDAVRCACRAWWFKINGSRWILASALQESTKDDRSLCDLLRALDYKTNRLSPADALRPACIQETWSHRVPKSSQYLNSWRTRFQVMTSHFSMSSNVADVRTRFKSFGLVLSREAERTSYSFAALEASCYASGRTEDCQNDVLFLYRFYLNDPPLYVGSIDITDIVEPFGIHVTETGLNNAWTLHISSGQKETPTIHLYSITIKQSFAKNESPFMVQPLDTCEDAQTSMDLDDNLSAESLPKDSVKRQDRWRLLAPFSSDRVEDEISCYSKNHPTRANESPSQMRRRPSPESDEPHVARNPTSNEGSSQVRFHLAEDTTNGKIAIVYRKDSDSDQLNTSQHEVYRVDDDYHSLALLLPPGKDHVFQNIATAQEIFWSGPALRLRVAVIWWENRHGSQTTESTLYVYEACQDIFIDFLQGTKVCHLQGRRVQSIPGAMGGVHPYSPVWSLHSSPATLEAQVSLSGLRFSHILSCSMWGPAKSDGSCQEISCRSYDFTHANYQRLSSSHGIPVAMLYKPWGRCVCPLHDLAFDVTLPAFTLGAPKTQMARPKLNPGFNGRPPYVERPKEDIGTIKETVSPARQKALIRLRDWQLERLEGMRGAGLSTYDVAQLWFTARWTQYGLMEKPEGWKAVGTSKVEKSEENKISGPKMQDYRVKIFEASP